MQTASTGGKRRTLRRGCPGRYHLHVVARNLALCTQPARACARHSLSCSISLLSLSVKFLRRRQMHEVAVWDEKLWVLEGFTGSNLSLQTRDGMSAVRLDELESGGFVWFPTASSKLAAAVGR